MGKGGAAGQSVIGRAGVAELQELWELGRSNSKQGGDIVFGEMGTVAELK